MKTTLEESAPFSVGETVEWRWLLEIDGVACEWKRCTIKGPHFKNGIEAIEVIDERGNGFRAYPNEIRKVKTENAEVSDRRAHGNDNTTGANGGSLHCWLAIMNDWKQYKRKGLSEMRPYVAGEDVSHVSISAPDKENGSPREGDMIARNPKNHADQWLVAKKYFEDNLEPA